MLHRLSRLPATDPNRIDLATVRDALVQQDIAPYWIDKFIALSYDPLTRTDTKRAFDIGVLDRAAVKESYQQQGYDDANAETLTRFAEKEKRLSVLRSVPLKLYIDGTYTRTQAESLLNELAFSPADQAFGFDNAKAVISARTRKVCQHSLEKRYYVGEITFDQLLQSLIDIGFDSDIATSLAGAAQCKFLARGKLAPLRWIKRFWDERVIGDREAQDRLQRIGYSAGDSDKLLATWLIESNRKLEAEQEKEQKVREKEVERQRKAEEAAQRRSAANANRAGRAILRAKQDAEKRAIAIVAASEKFAKSLDLAIDAVVSRANSLENVGRETYFLTANAASKIVVSALIQAAKDVDSGLERLTLEMFQSARDAIDN
jgi:hypothetical protein